MHKRCLIIDDQSPISRRFKELPPAQSACQPLNTTFVIGHQEAIEGMHQAIQAGMPFGVVIAGSHLPESSIDAICELDPDVQVLLLGDPRPDAGPRVFALPAPFDPALVCNVAMLLLDRRELRRRPGSERDAVVGRALGEVVHDLKAHIFTISGYARLLETGPRGEVTAYSSRIADVATQMKCYIDDLLEFAHVPRELRLVATDLVELARSIAGGFAPGLVNVEADGALPATADAVKLERALRNIIANAAEKAPSEAEAYRVTVKLAQQGSEAYITIEDNGSAIDASVRGSMFEPHVSHGKSSGTGLGLTIARDIIARHGGELSLDEARDGCNRFLIRLPRLAGID